jgi:hypothetical protein
MANKKGLLTKAETFYIQQNPDNLSPEEMSKTLKRSLSQIAKVEPAKSIAAIAKEETSGQISIKDLFGRREGIVVSTEAASEAGDRPRNRSIKKIDTKIMFKPFGN